MKAKYVISLYCSAASLKTLPWDHFHNKICIVTKISIVTSHFMKTIAKHLLTLSCFRDINLINCLMYSILYALNFNLGVINCLWPKQKISMVRSINLTFFFFFLNRAPAPTMARVTHFFHNALCLFSQLLFVRTSLLYRITPEKVLLMCLNIKWEFRKSYEQKHVRNICSCMPPCTIHIANFLLCNWLCISLNI